MPNKLLQYLPSGTIIDVLFFKTSKIDRDRINDFVI